MEGSPISVEAQENAQVNSFQFLITLNVFLKLIIKPVYCFSTSNGVLATVQ